MLMAILINVPLGLQCGILFIGGWAGRVLPAVAVMRLRLLHQLDLTEPLAHSCIHRVLDGSVI